MASSSSAGKSRSASKGVVVWEWFNEHGKWRPYSPEVVSFIDKEGQNISQVCLGNVSAALKMYTIDIPSMCQIRKGTGTSRPVRRVIYPSSSPAAQQVTWEYEGDQAGQWVAYDMEISACLEQAQQTGQQMLDMSSLFNLPYSVHFTTMQQVRMNTGRTRKIRRSPLQTPYPSAARSPRCFSKLTTVLPDPSLLLAAGTQPQPSTSAQNGSSATASASAVPGASGSSQKRGVLSLTSASSSDSDSDSDVSSGMILRLRTRQCKRLKKSHSQSTSAGKRSSKGADPSNASSVIGASMASASNSGAGPVATTLTPTASQGQHSTPGLNLVASAPYPMPTVSLVSTGPTLPLSLITYAQPLGANLTRGFPPMTHLPPSQVPAHSHHPSMHTQSSAHNPVAATSHNPPSQGQVHPASLPQQPAPQASSSHHVGRSFSKLGSHLGASHIHAHSSASSSSSSSSQVVAPAYNLLTPQPQSSGSWNMLSRHLPPSGSLGMTSPSLTMIPSSQTNSMSVIGTSQPAPAPTSQGPGASYQGPLTRNRVQKQLGAISGAGLNGRLMGGGGGGISSTMNNVHPLMSGLSHNFPPSQPQGHATTGSSLTHHQHPHQHPPQQQAVPAQPPNHPVSHSQHLQQMHPHFHPQHKHAHQQQQQQHPQQHLSGFGLAPSSYPFNQSSFTPTLGLNILPGSALLIPGSGSGQHSVSSASGPGSNPLRQQPGGNLPMTETLPAETKILLPKKKKAKTKPKTGEEVLARYMEIITPPENEDCCICFDALTAPSSYGEGKAGQCDVIQLNKCSHMFHRLCLLAMYDSSHKGDSLQCPTCKTIYGELMGNCPPGEMSYDILSRPLPGHPHCGTIRVTYYVSPGVQGPEHPHPGQRFTARGFPRSGFLPDDNRGRKILKLLMLAFKRKLMFTIGTSATTGESDTVTWNEIHHKTEFGSNISGHGYPDPNYLDNVTAELALKGVMEQDL